MRVLVLRSFPFSCDGVTSVQAIADTEADIPDALIAGLVAAGFVAALSVIGEPAPELMLDDEPPVIGEPLPPKRRRRS